MTWWTSMVKSGPARSRPCGHPPLYQPLYLLRAALWARVESHHRLGAEERLRRRCGAGPKSSICGCPWTTQADYGLVSKSAFDVRMGIMQRTPNRDLRRAASPSDVRGAQHAFYGATADFSETALAAFADAFLAGELSPHVKPDPRDE